MRVLDRQGQGDVEDVSRAVEYAVSNGANIINLSFVGSGRSQRLEASLARAYAAGGLIVVAAGNAENSGGINLNTTPRYPVCYDASSKTNWIIGVTAVDILDQRAPFANYGESCVDIAAPGYSIFSTQVYDLEKNLSEAYGGGWTGTSLAAPMVSGAAALIKARNRQLTPVDLTQILLDGADSIGAANPGFARMIGRGRLNAASAVLGSSSPGIKPPPEDIFEGGRLIAIPARAAMSQIRIFSSRGEQKAAWLAFDDTRRLGGTVAVGESARFTPEDSRKVGLSSAIRGEQIIIVGEGKGGLGRIRIFDITGQVQSQWYAFDRPFYGGLNVASGDIYGIGESIIIISPQANGGPQVRMFDKGGKLRGQFFAYDKNMRGGFSVAAADVDGDKKAEIIVSSTASHLPVRVFNYKGELIQEWFAYPSFRGGISVAAGDLDGSGISSILTAPQNGGGPQIRIFDGVGRVLGQFFTLPENFRGGLNLSVGDINSDGRAEIAVTPASAGGPQARFFTAGGRFIGQFFVYNESFRGGISLAIMR